jgi:hypothetical protein
LTIGQLIPAAWTLVRAVLIETVMKNLVVGFVLATCSIASAEPRVAALDLSTTELPAPAPSPTPSHADSYVSLGTTFGADTAVDWLKGGIAIDGGYRLTDSLWIRGRFDEAARIGYGDVQQVGSLPDFSGVSLRAPQHPHSDLLSGVEWRGCSTRALCAVGGFDAGIRIDDDKRALAGVTTVPRLGLDVGTEHLRFRPMVEASVAWQRGYDNELGGILPAFGIGLTTSVAYQW